MFGIVSRMTLPIENEDFLEIEGRDPRKAGYVDAKLPLVRAPLMVRINPAIPAEMMFRCPGVEPICS